VPLFVDLPEGGLVRMVVGRPEQSSWPAQPCDVGEIALQGLTLGGLLLVILVFELAKCITLRGAAVESDRTIANLVELDGWIERGDPHTVALRPLEEQSSGTE